MASVVLRRQSSVWPSAGAFATATAPTTVPCPPMLDDDALCRRSLSFSPSIAPNSGAAARRVGHHQHDRA